MKYTDIARKLASRKFWVCVCGFVSSIMAMYNFAQDDVTRVTALITSAGCLVAYIIAEGYIDGNRENADKED